MKKVGIMSMQRIANYGSFLQAYALRQLIEELGYKVEFVDYHVAAPVILDGKESKNKYVRKMKKALETFKYSAPVTHKISFIRYKQNFAKKYMPLLGISNEMNYNPALDCLVIGSDEVFNCIQKNSNVGYSLELFGKDNCAKKLITYEQLTVTHIEIMNDAERNRIQSSKYVQSDPKDTYSKVKRRLMEGKTVLYTGTPCQIAGLYAFLGRDQENLYTVDLICHGVPSPKFFKKYLEYQNRQMKENVIYFNFRSKDKRGWGTQYLLKTKTKTKTKILSLDRYGKHFMDGDCYRESCYQCSYANTKRVGDLTVGDFWGIAKSHPRFNSPKGVSSVLINTEKGQKLFDMMRSLAEVEEATLEEGMVKQGNLVRPSSRPITRNTFYDGIDEMDFIENMKVGFQLQTRLKSMLPNKVIQMFKSL